MDKTELLLKLNTAAAALKGASRGAIMDAGKNPHLAGLVAVADMVTEYIEQVAERIDLENLDNAS